MRISSVSVNFNIPDKQDAIDAVRSNLDAIAKAHSVDLDDLLAAAHESNGKGPAYLNRVLVLEKRLNKLIDQL